MSKDSPSSNSPSKKDSPGFEYVGGMVGEIHPIIYNAYARLPENFSIKLYEFSIDATRTTTHDFIPGRSLQLLKPLIAMLYSRKRNVCFIGERGSGKEILANEFMKYSETSKNLEKINCASYNDELLSSELFGHVKGAFTGADNAKRGILGSLKDQDGILLDELGAASEKFQAALLRVLQSNEFSPVGSEKRLHLKDGVIIMAATSEPEKIRSDVLDRFICIHNPPLRFRRDDIPFILRTIWEQTKSEDSYLRPDKISTAALDYLKEYSWPGNIRELKNVLEIALILTELDGETVIRTSAFPTIPTMPKETDTSNTHMINNLKDDGPFMPINNFLIGWPSIKDIEDTESRTEDTIDVIEKVFQETSPDTYHKLFWEHYASKDFYPKSILQRFPNIHSESHVRAKLRKHKR